MKKMIFLGIILILVVGTVFFTRYWGRGTSHSKVEVARFENHYKLGFLKVPLPYRLFIPEGYDESREYPLFLYLSSGMGQGYDNLGQLERGAFVLISDEVQGLEKCFVLAPQCPPYSQWVNTTAKTMPFVNYDQDKIPESQTMKQVLALIGQLEEDYNIDANRLYITGHSMGSSGTWDAITRHPQLFAAAFTSSGVCDPSKAAAIASMPIWAFHGEKDGVSTVNNTRSMVAALRKHGSQCRYTEYEGAGHGLPMVYKEEELFPWVFAQVRQ